MITFSSFFSPSSFLLHTRTIFPSFFPSFLLLRTLTLFFLSFFPLFSLPLPPNSRTFLRALFLTFSFSIFFLPFSLFSQHFVCKFLSLYPIKTHKLKGHTQSHHLILIKRSQREGKITKGRKSPPSFADLLCLHHCLSSSPLLLDLFPTTNDMWQKWVRSVVFIFYLFILFHYWVPL